MKCDKCGIDAQIKHSGTVVTGDDSPEKQTVVYTELIYECRNRQCEVFGKEIGETRHQVYPACE